MKIRERERDREGEGERRLSSGYCVAYLNRGRRTDHRPCLGRLWILFYRLPLSLSLFLYPFRCCFYSSFFLVRFVYFLVVGSSARAGAFSCRCSGRENGLRVDRVAESAAQKFQSPPDYE